MQRVIDYEIRYEKGKKIYKPIFEDLGPVKETSIFSNKKWYKYLKKFLGQFFLIAEENSMIIGYILSEEIKTKILSINIRDICQKQYYHEIPIHAYIDM